MSCIIYIYIYIKHDIHFILFILYIHYILLYIIYIYILYFTNSDVHMNLDETIGNIRDDYVLSQLNLLKSGACIFIIFQKCFASLYNMK